MERRLMACAGRIGAVVLVAGLVGALSLNSGVRDAGGESPGDTAIVGTTTLVETGGGRVDWSRANDLIAYSMAGQDGFFDVYTMAADGSNRVCLTCDRADVPQLHNDQPAWHPSGEWIVFQSLDPTLKLTPRMALNADYLTQGGAGVNNNLWLVNKDGTDFRQLTDIRNAQATLHPHFSPDGNQLFWSAIDSISENKVGSRRWMLKVTDFSLETLELSDERSYRPLADDQTFYESHGFTPDGKEIIFSANIGRDDIHDLDIWALNLDSGATRQMTDSPLVWDEHGQVSPSGEKVVWVSSEGYEFPTGFAWQRKLRLDFWIMDIDGSNKLRLTNMGAVPADSSWNRDGTKLVATLGKGPRYGIQIAVFEFSAPQ